MTTVFIGKEDHLVLCPNAALRSFGFYELLGKITAHLMRQGKMVMPGLAPFMKHMIFGQTIDEGDCCLTADDIPDPFLPSVVKKVHAFEVSLTKKPFEGPVTVSPS